MIVEGAKMGLMAALLIAGISIGLPDTFLIALVTLASLLSCLLVLPLNVKLLGYAFREQMSDYLMPLVCSAIPFALLIWVTRFISLKSSAFLCFVAVLLYGISYLLCLRALCPQFFKVALSLLRKLKKV